MILVDTSVWIDHLRQGDDRLAHLLEKGLVLCHPFVVGELALGNLRNPAGILEALLDLPMAVRATDEEVRRFIDAQVLHGLGIGYIDAHLLASVRLAPGSSLWTRDKRLRAASQRLGLAARDSH